MRPDGRIVSKYKAVRQPNLFGSNKSFYSFANASGISPALQSRPALEPGSSRMLSLIDVIGKGRGASIWTGAGQIRPARDKTVPENIGQQSQEYTQQQIEKLNKLVEDSVSWSVSIDGCFFEDGSFIGPDKTAFFENTKAEQDAEHDLLQEVKDIVASRHQQDKEFTGVFEHLQSVAGLENPTLSEFNRTGFYNYKKAIFARQILAVRKKVGEQRTIDYVREELNKPRLMLVKQKTER
jgi:hypothetical protein